MAETKNYISQYSGDQLDAAIAVLGSLDAMFISPEIFSEFKKGFDENMANLSGSVNEATTDLTNKVNEATTAANNATAKVDQATKSAQATIDKYDEIASQFHIIYEKIS